MFRKISTITILNKRTSLWCGIFVAAVLFSSIPAAAQCSMIWDASGKWSFRQANVKGPLTLDLTQNGKVVSGSASFVTPGSGVFAFGETKTGKVDGTILGDRFSIVISWSDRLEGVYNARILPSGKVEGEGYDKRTPNIRQAWSSTGVLKCPPVPAPRQNQSSPVPPANTGGSKPTPKPSPTPTKPKTETPPAPMKVPGIVASSPIFITPAHPTGLVVLTWDAGPEHPYAEVWYKIGGVGDPIRLLEKGKGSIQLQLTRYSSYTYILTDFGQELATVTFVVQ